MKRIILSLAFTVLAFFVKAQTISSLIISDTIECYQGTGDLTATVDNPTSSVFLFEWYVWNVSAWQTTGINGFAGVGVSSVTLDLTAQVSNTYKIEITNGTGVVVDSASINLSQPNPLEIPSSTETDVSCKGGNDAQSTLTVVNGTPPYSYQWSSSANNQNSNPAINLEAGSHTVIVTDANGCSVHDPANVPYSISIIEPGSFVQVTATSFSVSCYGGNNGQAFLDAIINSGNGGPYTYSWDNGSTNPTRQGLSAGTYKCLVTDQKGCTPGTNNSLADSTEVIISQPSAPLSYTAATVDVLCHGESTGSIAIDTAGGTQPIEIEWGDGTTNFTLANIPAGTYHFTLTDENNCVLQDTIEITQPISPISTTLSSTDVLCFGEDNGTASISASGGNTTVSGGHAFLWSNNVITANNDNLAAGEYIVTTTDDNNCTVSDTVNITQPDLLDVTFSVQEITCPGVGDGQITAHVIGGTEPYNYIWSTANTLGFTTVQDSIIEDLFQGQYNLVLEDNNNCQVIISRVMNEPSIITYDSAQITHVYCFGGTDGQIIPNIQGATPPYSYQWPNGSTNSSISMLSAGTYTLELNDDNNCFNPPLLIPFTVIDSSNGEILLSLDTNHITCNGYNNGDAFINVTGGNPPYSYEWSYNSLIFSTNQGVDSLAPGIYSVTVTDMNACEHELVFDIYEPAPLIIGNSINQPSCYGYNDGSITALPTGGTIPYNYVWQNQNHSGPNAFTLSGLSTGNQIVTVNDINGCVAIQLIYLPEPSEITLQINTQANLCNGGSTGAAFASVIDVTSNTHNYFWSNGDTVQNIGGLSAGSYSLYVVNGNGCSQTEFLVDGALTPSSTFNITEPDSIIVSAIVTDLTTYGANDGSIDASNVTGGTPFYDWSWFNSNGFASVDPIITGLSPATYNLTVTDNNGCDTTLTYTVNDTICNLLIDTTLINPNCYGENAIELSWEISNGVGPYETELRDNNNVTVFGPITSNLPVTCTTPLPAGGYNLIVNDLGVINGVCSATLPIVIEQPDSLVIDFITSDVTCNGDDNGSLAAIASGGTQFSNGSYNYLWSNNVGSNPLTNYNVTGLPGGTYYVTVTDAKNCQKTKTVSIHEPSELVIDSTASTLISCLPGADGTATVYASGGTQLYNGTYNYSWTIPNIIPQTTQTASQLSIAGSYSVDVTDQNGCNTTTTVNVDNAPSVILVDSVNQPLCYNDSSGSVYANVLDGTPPYIYNWSLNNVPAPQYNNSFNFINNLGQAIYSVTVEDSYGCTNGFTVQIIDPAPLGISTFSDNVSFFGGNDGWILTNVSGGQTPYSYDWNGPNGYTSTLPNISALFAGTYSLIVTDANGCTFSHTENISQPSCGLAFDTVITSVIDPLCFGDPGGITWAAYGGGGTVYEWKLYDLTSPNYLYNGQFLPFSTVTQTNLPAGNYYLQIDDFFGCSEILNFTISPTTQLSANIIVDSASCFGYNDGSIELQGVGGTPPYFPDYGVNPSTGIPLDENNLNAGVYPVTITDVNGCTPNPSIFFVQVYEPNELTVDTSTVGVSCFGASDGQLSLTVAGGTAPYNYAWNNPLQLFNTPTIANLAASSYFVTVTDANGCFVDGNSIPTPTQVIVPGPSQSLSVSIDVNDAQCYNESNGSAEAMPVGGTAPYSYVWSTGGTTKQIFNLSAGSYSCVVTDANGCTSFAFATVSEPNEILVNLTTTDITCFGLEDGTAQVVPTGGSNPQTGYDVIWSLTDSLGIFYTSYNVSNIAEGVYNVTVSDNGLPGCDVTEYFVIQEPNLLEISASVHQIVTCDQGSDGAVIVDVTPNTGRSPYTYNWSTTFNNSISTDSLVENLNSIWYFVDVTDSSGCQASDSIFLNSNAPLQANITFNPVSCFGGSDGIAYSNPTGGTGPYSYFWGTTGSTSNQSMGHNGVDYYTLQVTDANGCPTLYEVFNVPQPDSIIVYSTVDSVSCFQGTDGSVRLDSIIGGNPPFNMLWTGGQTDSLANNLMAGSYTIHVTDALGCVDSLNTYSVYQPDELVTVITVTTNYNGSGIQCYNDSTGEISVTVTGGTASYNYLWLSNGDTLIGETLSIVDSLPAGSYHVNVIDYNGCQDNASIALLNPDTILFNFSLSNYNGNNVSCNAGTNGTIVANLTGGSGGIDYTSIEWRDDNGLLVSPTNILNDTSLFGLEAGTYSITVSDFNGCSSTSSVTLTEPAPIQNFFVTDSVTCYGGSDGSIYSNVSGGTAPYQYSWTISNSDSSSAHALMANTPYELSVIDLNGCPFLFSTIEVLQPDSLFMNAVLTSPTCNGINDGLLVLDIVSGANPGYNFLWSNGSTATILNNLYGDSTYSCVVTDALGCVDSSYSFYLAQPDVVVADITIETDYNGADVNCYGDTNAILLASGTGGVGPYTYLWSTGHTTDSLINVGAGTYVVTVTDANGCDDIHSFTVVDPDTISITYTISDYNGSDISCNGNSDGSINTVITGGNGIDFSTLLWSTGDTTLSISNLSAGTYSVSVEDINNCIGSLNIIVTEPSPLQNYFVLDSVTCNGGSDGAAYTDPIGGTAPYQFTWSTGSTNDTIVGLNGSTQYFIQLTDINNCPSVVDSFMIPQPDSLQVTSITTLPTCHGYNDGSIFITNVSGNTGPYSYLWNDSISSNGTVLANANSGQYICTITDLNGCVEDVLFSIDTVYALIVTPSIVSDYNGADVSCYGDTNAIIVATSTGGTSPYTYSWDTGVLSDTLSNVGAGTYVVTVTDDNGCNNFNPITVINPDTLNLSISTSDYNGFEISCFGLTDGLVTANASGGNGINFNSLLWNTGDTTLSVSNLAVGTYSFTVQDINGCSGDAQITLSSPSAIVLDLTSDSLSCYGNSNASATISNIQNTINPVSYLWSDGQTSLTANNLSSGTYTLVITDDNNCTASQSIDIYQPDSLVSDLIITSSYNGSDISCYGYSDAFASISSSGGVSPYVYSLDSIYFSGISSFNNLSAGNFEIITRDANGCVISNTITITQPDPLLANLQVVTNPSCNGVFNGSLTSLTTGGVGQYYYTWSSPNSTTNLLGSLTEGTYTVVIADDNGCTVNDSINLDAIYGLTSATSTTQVTCTGSSDGTATVFVSNGVLPYTYLWDNGSINQTATGLFAGTYFVNVIDSNGCQLTDSVLVTESANVLTFTSTLSDLLCNSDSSGTISVSVSGGVGPYAYNWSNGSSTSSLSNLSAGSYILDVSDIVGCVVSDTFTLIEPLAITYNLLSSDVVCYGENNGTADVQVSGGTSPYSYSWIGPFTYTSNNSMIDNLLPGQYIINFVDNNGCNFSDTVNVMEPQLLVSSVSVTDPLCHDSDDGEIIIDVQGGILPYSSVYGTLIPSNIISNTIVYSNLSSNSDTLFVYDSNNCQNYHLVDVVAPEELVVYNLITNDPTCYDYSNGTASMNALGGTQPYSYQLLDNNSNLVSNNSNYSNLSSGLYIYAVTDLNGCIDDVSFEIMNPDEITVTSTNITNVDCYGDNTGELTVNISDYVGSYDVIWLPSEFNTNDETITNLTAGIYNIVVVDENGCTKLDSFEVIQNDKLELDYLAYNASCKSSADGQIDLFVNGGVGNYTISNNSIELSNDVLSTLIIDNLPINTYNITITDSYNCKLDTAIVVGFDGGYNCIDEPTIITPNNDDFNDVWVPIVDLDTDIEVIIMNRWGQKEYYYSGNSLSFIWNGKANWGGQRDLPSSDYYYIIKFNNDNYSDKTGVITLIR